MYPSVSHRPLDDRLIFAASQIVWIASWLTGWEFLHRYVLISTIKKAWPALVWPITLVIVPLIETLYHVGQGKAPIESAAVLVFSLALCAWTLHRENIVGPALAHGFIEAALILFLVLA
jgi:membrane protease YdiL (CAAX protease family)